MLLARRGHRVALVDRARFPSDTISSHFLWQRGAARGVDVGSRSDGTVRLDARVVVGADGRNSFLANAVGADAYWSSPSLTVVYYELGERRRRAPNITRKAEQEEYPAEETLPHARIDTSSCARHRDCCFDLVRQPERTATGRGAGGEVGIAAEYRNDDMCARGWIHRCA